MTLFAEIKSCYHGLRKATRDYHRIMGYFKEHDLRHAADPHYICAADARSFWQSLGNDIDATQDTLEAAVYYGVMAYYQNREKRRWIKKNRNNLPLGAARKAPAADPGPQISFLRVEVDENDTPESVMAKAKQAILDGEALENLVSETVGAPEPAAPESKSSRTKGKHRKEGK